MLVQCAKCLLAFDDEFRDTGCPHDTFAANDGANNFTHHPDSYRGSVADAPDAVPPLERIEGPNAADTHDKLGREWAKVSEVVAGSKVSVDNGFGCLTSGVKLVTNVNGGLAIYCGRGLHLLAGQLNRAGTHYVGFYPFGYVAPATDPA